MVGDGRRASRRRERVLVLGRFTADLISAKRNLYRWRNSEGVLMVIMVGKTVPCSQWRRKSGEILGHGGGDGSGIAFGTQRCCGGVP